MQIKGSKNMEKDKTTPKQHKYTTRKQSAKEQLIEILLTTNKLTTGEIMKLLKLIDKLVDRK